MPKETPARRTVLRLMAAGAGIAALGGCSVRSDSTPAITVTGERTPVPDEEVLRAMAQAAMSAALLATTVTGNPVTAALATLHTQQAEVIRARLRDMGVPASALPTVPSTVTGPTPPDQALSELTSIERRGLVPLSQALAATQSHRALVISAATMTDHAAQWLGAPAGDTAPSTSAATLMLAEAYALADGFTVVAAQSGPESRRVALGIRDALTKRISLLRKAVGPQAAGPAQAYPLPLHATTPARAHTLGQRLLDDALARAVASARGSEDLTELSGWLPWTTLLQSHGRAWGTAPSAFPGMTIG